MHKLLVPALLLLGFALSAAPASAVDFCVAPDTTCGGVKVGDLQTALNWAAVSTNADRIFLGDATYTAPTTGFGYDLPTGPVELIGDSPGYTILTGPASDDHNVLTLIGAAGTSAHDLKVLIPDNVAANAIGVRTNGVLDNLDVLAGSIQPNEHEGVQLEGGGTLENSLVGLSRNNDNTAVAYSSGNNVVRNSVILGYVGIDAEDSGTIERVQIQAATAGIVSHRGTQTIASSMIEVGAPGAYGIYGGGAASQGAAMKIDGVDVVATNQGAIAGIEASNTGAAGTNVSFGVDNSVIRGYPHAVESLSAAVGSGKVKLAVNYSDYDGSGNVSQGPNATLTENHVSNVGDAGVWGPDGWGDLLPTSPLVDSGDPAEPQGFDLAGLPLVADGNGDGIARRDIGAIEVAGVNPPASGGSDPQQQSGPADAPPTTPTPAPSRAAPDTQPPLVTS